MRTALCVGINYVDTEYELRGCINDVEDWSQLFGSQGFAVNVLVEKKATRRSILQQLEKLIRTLYTGDVGVFTYSGHGTWVPDKSGDEPDGRDEAICPYDMGEDGKNLILDDELRNLFSKIPTGARVFFVSDSCHSGTVFRFLQPGVGKRRVRFLPPAHFLKDINAVYRMTRAFGQPVKSSNAAIPGLIQLSGCKDNEYSTDAEFDRANGALTYYAIRALKHTLSKNGSYMDAWRIIRGELPNWEFQQTPLLNATPALKKVKLF